MSREVPGVDEPDDPWYSNPDEYWVPAAQAGVRPYRYGDLFSPPATDAFDRPLLSSGKKEMRHAKSAVPVPWHGVLVLSPSCDVVSKSGDDTLVEVARVKNLALQSAPRQAAITAGWRPSDEGPRVAFSAFTYLAAVPGSATHGTHMYGDFRATTWVRYTDLVAAGRLAALDHDARVHLIRREIHYKYRWVVTLAEVRAAEADRIRKDRNFVGPRPSWAS